MGIDARLVYNRCISLDLPTLCGQRSQNVPGRTSAYSDPMEFSLWAQTQLIIYKLVIVYSSSTFGTRAIIFLSDQG